MKNILIAAALAAATMLSPAVLIVSSSVAAIDCTNPAAPESRPGGYCSLSSGAGDSLSEPVTTPPPAPTSPPLLCGSVDLNLPQAKGDRVRVAGCFNPCVAAIELPAEADDRIRVATMPCFDY